MKKSLLIAFIFLGIGVHISKAQIEQFKALYIYNVTSFVEWPGEHDKITICTPQNPPTIQEFKKNHGNKTAGGVPFEIKTNVDINSIPDCQIFFLPKSMNDQFDQALANIKGKPVLLFTDGEGLANKGSCLNFAIENGKLTLEINRGNIERQQIKVNHQLLQLGKSIE